MATFSLSRSTTVDAPADRVRTHLDDLREWQHWSPWEGLDPDLSRTYTGPGSGVGARYAWQGNAKAGAGHLEVTASTPSRVVLDLVFRKPFRATNVTTFDLAPAGAGATRVTWTMTGRRNPAMQLLGRLFFDRAIGRDFERGLARLRTLAEARA